jgi:D-glycero-D-manno-heptose 1,7-bisphosphate phosphatase
MMRSAAFLDRDGVIIEEVGYLSAPEQVALIPGAAEAIAALNGAGIPVVVITNQAGVGHGYFPETQIAAVHQRLDALLARAGARIDRYYYCSHHPAAALPQYRRVCECRKPRPGMLLQAAAELGLALATSVMVGDKSSDLAAGLAAGCRPLLVKTGYGASMVNAPELQAWPLMVAADLAEAVHRHILPLLRGSRAA